MSRRRSEDRALCAPDLESAAADPGMWIRALRQRRETRGPICRRAGNRAAYALVSRVRLLMALRRVVLLLRGTWPAARIRAELFVQLAICVWPHPRLRDYVCEKLTGERGVFSTPHLFHHAKRQPIAPPCRGRRRRIENGAGGALPVPETDSSLPVRGRLRCSNCVYVSFESRKPRSTCNNALANGRTRAAPAGQLQGSPARRPGRRIGRRLRRWRSGRDGASCSCIASARAAARPPAPDAVGRH